MKTDTKTILVVDDEPIIRNSFMDYFEDHEWNTLEADSGESAHELIKTMTPDAVIVDVRMSGMDGNTFIRQAYESTRNTVFFISTGSPEYEIPPDLKKLPRVSDNLFKKPIQDLSALEKDVIFFIEKALS